MKFLNNTNHILILILVLASFLRIPLLEQLPAGITIDEAGQGYSAYSILKTGKDEWGDFLPINPRGFGDYKPPVFMYLLVPSIAVFGLNELAVRLPSAVAGILTVLVIFFLVRDLFKDELAVSRKNLGLLVSFFMAVAPWHIYYSRLGWESNIGLLFFCLGIWIFIVSLTRKNLLMFSVLSFGLSALSYHSFKVISPLMFIALWLIYKNNSKFGKKSLFSAGVVGSIFIATLAYGFIFSGASRRVEDQSVFKEENLMQLRENQFDDKFPQPLNRVFNNKYLFTISKVTDNYIAYYSFPFLFGPHRSSGSVLNFPTQGLLYIWQLPLILSGFFYLIRNFSKFSKVIFAWTLIAPIPAAIAQDYMHAGRAQVIFPALTIISAVGVFFIFGMIKNKFKRSSVIFAGLIITVSLILRIDKYLFHTFNNPHGGLVSGYKNIIDYTQQNKDKYDKIIFTKSNSEPQAFIAFYTKWDPEDFQSNSKNWKRFEQYGYKYLDMTDYSLGKYEFKKPDVYRDRNEVNVLIIGTDEEIPPLISRDFVVNDGTGKIIFAAVKSDEIPK